MLYILYISDKSFFYEVCIFRMLFHSLWLVLFYWQYLSQSKGILLFFFLNWSSNYQFFLSWMMLLVLFHWHLDFLLLSSRSLIILCFTFMSMSHFVLIFVKCVRYVSRFFFFRHTDVQLFPAPFIKRLSLLYCLCSFPKIRWYIYVGLFLSSLFHSIDLFICSFTTVTLFWLASQ